MRAGARSDRLKNKAGRGAYKVSEQRIDARGLACPKPVLLAREAMAGAAAGMVRLVVDNASVAENVRRMAESQGWTAVSSAKGEYVEVVLERPKAAATAVPAEVPAACAPGTRTPALAVLIASDQVGAGDERLGRILMRSFVKTLRDIAPRPQKVIFMNAGVRLTTEGSELLDDIAALAGAGVEVLSCGTCLDYFNLKDKLRVGRVSNMFEITSALASADRVLRP